MTLISSGLSVVGSTVPLLEKSQVDIACIVNILALFSTMLV